MAKIIGQGCSQKHENYLDSRLTNFASKFLEKTKIMRHHEVQRRFTLKKQRRRTQTPKQRTSGIGQQHRHTRALNNGGKMNICKTYQTFEVIE